MKISSTPMVGYGDYLMLNTIAYHLIDSGTIEPKLCFRSERLPLFSSVFDPRLLTDQPEQANSTFDIRKPGFFYQDYFRTRREKRLVYHRDGIHFIERGLRWFGLSPPKSLHCHLTFTRDEIEKIDRLELPPKFYLIEPAVRRAENRVALDRFQQIVDSVPYPAVEIGVRKKALLNNVIDLTGRFSFREVARLMFRATSAVFVEGGLNHAASVSRLEAVVLLPPFNYRPAIAYPSARYLDLGPHADCQTKSCSDCQQTIEQFDPTETIETLTEILDRA